MAPRKGFEPSISNRWFDEPAPKKSKPAAKAEPKKETKSVEDYNDIDAALDDLDFEDA